MKRLLFLATLALCVVCFALTQAPAPTPVGATPLNWGTGSNGKPITLRWPDNTTIHVYIPECPTDPAANDSVRAGIAQWAGLLASKGIKLEFHMGPPPPNATNAVVIQWVEPGTCDPDDAKAEPVPNSTGTNIGGGTIQIERQDPPADYTLVNNGIHEGGHIFGLDNDPTPGGQPPNVMDPSISDVPPQGFSPRDSAEIKSLYGIPEIGHARAEVSGMASGGLASGMDEERASDAYLYEYWVYWIAGPEIPSFEVSLNCPPTTVLPLAMPPGWILDYPPTYTDAWPSPAAGPNTEEFHYRSMGAGLSAAMPVGYFALGAPWPPGPGWAQVLADNDGDGEFDYFPVPVPTGPLAVPDSDIQNAGRLTLLSPIPNPSAGATQIRFVAPRAFAAARIEIFDLRGARVWSSRPLAGGAGAHAVAWDGRTEAGARVPAGIYFCTVRAAAERAAGLLVRVR